jgi:MFS family permease
MRPRREGLSGFVPSRRLAGPAAFWAVAALFVLVLATAGVPTPLYRVYQQEFGFSSGVLTTVFGIYAFALLATLLVVGALSDHVGRRPVIAVGMLLQAVAMGLFLAADGVGWLLAARVVQGVSVGALTGALGATLLDLQRGPRPLGAMVNAATPTFGLAIGAVGTGLLVEHVAEPTRWVFAPLTIAFVVAAASVLALPETSPRRPGAVASLRPQVSVPRSARAAFLLVVPALVAMWSLGGLYLSLGPSLASGVFGVDDHLVGSLLILAMQGTAGVGSVATWRVPARTSMLAGTLTFAVGVAVTVLSLATASMPLFFAGAMLSGLGFGSAFLGATATITRDVPAGERGGLLSSVFVVGYLAFSVPAIVAGLVVDTVGLQTTAEVYGVVVVVLALVAVTGLLRRRQAERRTAGVERAEPVTAQL